MANRYGEAALMAVRMETYGKNLTPQQRWEDAIKNLYPTSPTSQKKSCPKGAFVGLCEIGLVKGIPAGRYVPGNLNAGYAIEAVRLLQTGTHKTVSQLWNSVAGEDKKHNSQMDVVLALWKNNLILLPKD